MKFALKTYSISQKCLIYKKKKSKTNILRHWKGLCYGNGYWKQNEKAKDLRKRKEDKEQKIVLLEAENAVAAVDLLRKGERRDQNGDA